MNLREVMTELGISRDSVYRRIRDKRLNPLPKINPNRDKEPLRFSRAEVHALKVKRE